MLNTINLKLFGINLYKGRLFLHDYLWFSSNEISKVSSTIPVLHNYALSYAINRFSYGLYEGSVPRYFEDLQQMSVYATPATADKVQRTKFTYNAVDTRTLRTDIGPRVNTPDLGERVCINPDFGRTDRGGFEFFLFAKAHFYPPSVVRLGKKGATARIVWKEIDKPQAILNEEPCWPTHPVNPLDTIGELTEYDPIAIPPHLVLRKTKIKNDWFIRAGQEVVLLPKFVRESWIK